MLCFNKNIMFDDLVAYFHENVVESYNDFSRALKNNISGMNTDLRLAINSATALYHFREHIPKSHQKTRKKLAKKCPDYDLLGDIVNSAKHFKLTRGIPQISSANDIFEQIVFTKYRDEEGEYFSAEKTVLVKLKDNSDRNIQEILINVLNMWFEEMFSINILGERKQIIVNKKKIPLSRKEANKNSLNLKALQGIRFKQKMKFQEYNYKTGKVSPINLSGTEIIWRVYKPKKIIVELCAKNEHTGEIIKQKIHLTEEQNRKLEKLNTEKDKQLFLSELAYEQGILNEIIKEIKKTKHNNSIQRT